MTKIVLYHGSPNKKSPQLLDVAKKSTIMGRDFILRKTENLLKNGPFVVRMNKMDGFINMSLKWMI